MQTVWQGCAVACVSQAGGGDGGGESGLVVSGIGWWLLSW